MIRGTGDRNRMGGGDRTGGGGVADRGEQKRASWAGHDGVSCYTMVLDVRARR